MLDQTHYSRERDKYSHLKGKRILVIEDDAVVAVDYYFQLREIGAKPLAYQPTNDAALDYLATHQIDAAIVDYQLRDGSCEPVLKFLQTHGIPFVVVSGHTFQMHANVGASHVLSKPVMPSEVRRALSDALH